MVPIVLPISTLLLMFYLKFHLERERGPVKSTLLFFDALIVQI